MSARNFTFTINNYEDTQLVDNIDCKYIIYGKEKGESGTPHLQGYFSLKTKAGATIKTLQNKFKKLDIGIALLTAEASAESNRLYATKDRNDIYEFGDITETGKGARTDLKRVSDAIDAGAALKKVARENPVEFIKFHHGIEKYSFIIEEDTVPAVRDLTVALLHGDAGAGKTRACIEFCKRNNLTFYKLPHPNNSTVWFDGYCRHDVLIIDDFKSWIKYHDLLDYIDCYKTQLPVKGGFVWAYYKYVFITSNTPWNQWYNAANIEGYTAEAINRRIHKIYCYLGKYPDTEIIEEK